MPDLLKTILIGVVAVFAGMVVGMAWNMGFVQLNTSVLFPMPEGVTFEDADAFAKYLEGLPAAAFLVTMVAHLGQSFFGALVASFIARKGTRVVAMIIGVLSLIGGVMAMSMFGGPAWMWIEMPLYLVLSWWAAQIVLKRRAA